MALKAGYIGIKKSMLGLINSLASTKLIKSFGDGLNLTQAGELNMTAATASKIGGVKVGDGLSIDEGVLSVDSVGGVDYSTEEVDTGLKWTDGKPIYRKVYYSATKPASGASLITGVETVVNAYGSQRYTGSGAKRFFNFPFTGTNTAIRYELIEDTHVLQSLITETNFDTCNWVFEYTKITEEEE